MVVDSLTLDTALKLVNSYGLPLVLLFLLGRWLKPKVDKAFEVAMRLDESERHKALSFLVALDVSIQKQKPVLLDPFRSRWTFFPDRPSDGFWKLVGRVGPFLLFGGNIWGQIWNPMRGTPFHFPLPA